MDELDLLKKDWKKGNTKFPKKSYDEIYKMILKKSSSIVKWIFIISVIELGLGLLSPFINLNFDGGVKLPNWAEYITYLSLAVIIYFMVLFYKNYKRISSTDTVKELIDNILKTRRTVRNYILFNLILVGIFFAVGLFIGITDKAGGLETFNADTSFGKYALVILVIVIATALFLGLVYGIYYLLYGLLLKRLNKNYKELKKLEV